MNSAIENWRQRMNAVVDPSALDLEQLRFLIETSKSVVELGQVPAIDGHAACEVDKAIVLETMRFSVKLVCPVPDPIDVSSE